MRIVAILPYFILVVVVEFELFSELESMLLWATTVLQSTADVQM